jgi:hypothetical protein
MNMKMDLQTKLRKGSKGERVVAPYINQWNVWDIPEKEWTEAVAEAIARAYVLGARHAITEVSRSTEAPRFDLPVVWENRT